MSNWTFPFEEICFLKWCCNRNRLGLPQLESHPCGGHIMFFISCWKKLKTGWFPKTWRNDFLMHFQPKNKPTKWFRTQKTHFESSGLWHVSKTLLPAKGEKTPTKRHKLHTTVSLFFGINVLRSFLELLKLLREAHQYKKQFICRVKWNDWGRVMFYPSDNILVRHFVS